jgi:hypothetical protein
MQKLFDFMKTKNDHKTRRLMLVRCLLLAVLHCTCVCLTFFSPFSPPAAPNAPRRPKHNCKQLTAK